MNTSTLGAPVVAALVILSLIPFGIGAALVSSGYIYISTLRWAAYEGMWSLFGMMFVVAATLQHCSALTRLKTLGRPDLIAIAMVFLVLIFSSRFFAPYPFWTLLYGMSAPVTLLVGAASAQLAYDRGAAYAQAVSLSLFGGILLHASVVLWFQMQDHTIVITDWAQLAAPAFLNMRHYAFSLEIGIPLGVGLLLVARNLPSKIFIFVGIAILWSLLIWTGARGAILALFASLVLSLLIIPSAFKTFSLIALTSASAGAILSLLYYLPDNRFGLVRLAARTVDVQSVNQLSSSRIDMWSEAITLIQRNPLFGYGPGQFSLLSTFKSNLHPHNVFLDIFLSIGAIGGVFLIYLMIKLWVTAVVKTRRDHPPIKIAIFWAVNSLIAHSMLAGSLFFTHSRLIFAILIGILVAESLSKPSRRTQISDV